MGWWGGGADGMLCHYPDVFPTLRRLMFAAGDSDVNGVRGEGDRGEGAKSLLGRI